MLTLFGVILGALLPLCALIAIGYGLRRASILTAEVVPTLNNLVLNLLLPASIIRGLGRAPAASVRLFGLPVLLLIAELAMMALCMAVARHRGVEPRRMAVIMLVAAFGNTAFLGYPVTLALLPAQFPATVLLDEFAMTLALYPLAPLLGGLYGVGGNAKAAVRAFLRGPLFLAVAAGLLLRYAPLPSVATSFPFGHTLIQGAARTLELLAQATTPVVLLAFGAMLDPSALERRPGLVHVVCAAKLLGLPLLMLALCRGASMHGGLLAVGVLQAAMPSSVMTAVLSERYGLDAPFALRVVFTSTLLALLTLPLMLLLAR